MELSQYLKDWRQRAGIPQSKAAKWLQLPLPTYQGIEQGRPFKYAHMLILAVEAMEARGSAHIEEQA